MQGIHVINDPNGNPAVLTIDLHNLDPDVSPFVSGLLDLLEQRAEDSERADFRAAAHAALNRAYNDDEPDCNDVPGYEYAASFGEERREFLDASGILANRAYGDDEPEYTVADLKWINPSYRPRT